MNEVVKVRIGAWIATPALNLLERDARAIRIEPRAMDVLMFLAQKGGAVVSVEEMIASVWKGVIVGDGSVYLAIRQLRQALDNPADGPSYIETIAKRGYRLTVPVGPVESGPAPVAQAAGQAVAPPSPHKSTRAPLGWLAAAVAVAVVLALAAWALRDRTPPVAGTSVAVLPFENLSSDPEQAYFSDGITTQLLEALSRIHDLRVTSRGSSFHYKNSDADVRSIGAALGVEHILQGSVRRAGDRVRITAELSDARSGDHLWSQTYERRLDDIFALQDEIAGAVANALQVKLGVGKVGRAPGMTHDVAAYDEYLRGQALNIDWRAESFPLAIAHLERAVAIDPAFSMAWTGLHSACVNGAYVVPERADEWRRKAQEALDRAQALTPDAPHVLLEIGVAETRHGQLLQAAATFKKLEASYARYGMPNQAWAPHGIFLLAVGRVREAIPAIERARADDPLVPEFAGFLSMAYAINGDLADALAEIDRGLKLEGLQGPLRGAGLSVALIKQDRAEIAKRLAALPDSEPEAALNRKLAGLIDTPDEARAEIRRLAATASRAEKGSLVEWAAYYHEPELSLTLLGEIAHDLDFGAILWDPLLRDVRKLPAFKNIVREMGLVDYWRAYGWSDFCHPLGEADFVCG